MRPRSRDEFRIVIICALALEADAVEALFDERYDELGDIYGKNAGDDNSYATGRIGVHPVVLTYMPGIGNRRSASVARGLRVSFTGINLALVVGVCSGVPYLTDGAEIVLGDVVISDSIVEYDFGRQYPNGFKRRNDTRQTLGPPTQEIQSFTARLQTRRMKAQLQKQIVQHLEGLEEGEGSYPGILRDTLFSSSYRHKHHQQQSCICADCHSNLDPVCEQALKIDCEKLGCGGESIPRYRLSVNGPEPGIHIGTIASANSTMESGEHRDELAEKEDVIGFEMGGAGVWDILPCIVIKGVCDYADSHKNKAWQNYAAATAAGCTKALLRYWVATPPVQVPQILYDRKPSSIVPFERDGVFVSRRDILAAINETVHRTVDASINLLLRRPRRAMVSQQS